MKVSYTVIVFLISLSSCMEYANIRAISKPEEKWVLQDFYSPCCGSCGERIVTEINGNQYMLLVSSKQDI